MTATVSVRPSASATAPFRASMIIGLLLLTVLAGCSGTDRAFDRATDEVNTIALGDPVDIDAMVLARAMLRAGFSHEEILDKGPGIRRSLASTGGAEARRSGTIVALFSHKEGELYVTGAQSGTFVVTL